MGKKFDKDKNIANINKNSILLFQIIISNKTLTLKVVDIQFLMLVMFFEYCKYKKKLLFYLFINFDFIL